MYGFAGRRGGKHATRHGVGAPTARAGSSVWTAGAATITSLRGRSRCRTRRWYGGCLAFGETYPRVPVELAVHLHSLRHLAPDAALHAAAAAGFEAVELWLPHASPAQLAGAARASGLRVVAIGGLGVYDAADVDSVESSARLALDLGVDLVVGCVLPQLLPAAVSRLPPGVRLAVENHWDQPLARARQLLRASAPFDAVGACLDTGHALRAGELPAAAVDILGDRLLHVHLKDARRREVPLRVLGRRVGRRLLAPPKPVFPGTGDLDVSAFLARLLDAGYTRSVTVEYEGADAEAGLEELSRLAADGLGRARDQARGR
jgi:sugar phosphate isomerase/epimerase